VTVADDNPNNTTQLLVAPKRRYTMSEQALAARQANAQKSTGPVTDEGKAASSRNAWKTGEYAAKSRSMEWQALGALYKPCKSTCAKFASCGLVEDGKTQPGGDCLDKEVFVEAYHAIMSALHDEDVVHTYGMLASAQAGAMEILDNLRFALVGEPVVAKPIINKMGEVVINPTTGTPYEIPIINPAILPYIKLLEAVGINLPELMATPKAQAALKQGKADTDAVTELMRAVAKSKVFDSPPLDGVAEVVE